MIGVHILLHKLGQRYMPSAVPLNGNTQRKRDKTMKQITYQEASQMLSRAGCTEAEIDRLYQLHCAYQMGEWDHPSLDLPRLQFIRWLVTTGRLTEGLPETKEQNAPHLNEEQARLRATLPTRCMFLLFRRKE